MYPTLFQLQLWPGELQASMPVFAVLVALLIGLMSAAPKIAEKNKLLGKLVMILPVAAFATAFITFVRTPFGDGKLPINSYGFAIMVGFLLCSWIAVKRAAPLGIKSDFILDLGIIAMIAGILGAKINYLLQYGDELKGMGQSLWGDMGLNPLGALILGPIPFAFWFWRMKTSGEKVVLFSWQSGVLLVLTLFLALMGTRALYLYNHSNEYNWEVFKRWQSGFVLYGGLIAGVAAGVLYIKMRGQSVAVLADLSAPSIMLALAFGRIGCFMNGCCHGQKGDSFLCMSFPANSPASVQQGKPYEKSLPVHPTQLYETAAALAFFFFLSWLYNKKRKANGEIFLIMGMLYAAWRFVIEFVRGDKRPQWLGELSYSQVVSIVLFAVAGIWLFLLRSRPPAEAPPQPPPPPAEPAVAPPKVA
ncbi:MAG: prolipoprotein diacylglyceryl transferase [Planctomycetota bacterium]|nr:MAG: prolipoprotein diacylglyceryl transferase [Planctomycetota bacterium]